MLSDQVGHESGPSIAQDQPGRLERLNCRKNCSGAEQAVRSGWQWDQCDVLREAAAEKSWGGALGGYYGDSNAGNVEQRHRGIESTLRRQDRYGKLGWHTQPLSG